ncbi:MAG TPA: prepilin-type N-terminal cleavage/methylation domain-containing protein [Thermosulfurimonas dismutans]|uniref:Prepilin-type N-terminal cleavage/methylation domain-containing protein n=1 Tax=Thermosulfurimonas dismutans TaxID=999894 RepID=A0A7C3GLL9_9BACT|nr:prepilin-type N-terminal cleavage/methylation domain-containing protein [Thermosulfurimonas dismutans]
MKGNRGFTLLEVLVVLLLLALIFGAVITVFRTAGRGALTLQRDAERLSRRTLLSYRLRYQLEGLLRSFRLERREDVLYMGFVTSVGETYPGVVQVRYRYKGKELFYCEKPYPYGEILSCDESREISLGTFENFKVMVFHGGRWWSEEEGFFGTPEKVEVDLEDTRMIVPVRVGRVWK